MTTEEVIGNNTVGATEKPFKFEGLHFKRWQQKMYFFLTLKKVVYVLNQDIPAVPAASSSGTKELSVTNGVEKSVADKDKDQTDPTAAQIKDQELQQKKKKDSFGLIVITYVRTI
jgi:hypothetical protein